MQGRESFQTQKFVALDQACLNNIAHLLVTSVLQQGCCCFLIPNPVLRVVLAAPCILQRAALLAGNCLCTSRKRRIF